MGKKLTRQQVEKIVREARKKGERPDLSGVDLSKAELSGVDLSRANLSWANLSRVYLIRTDFRRANLSGANLIGTYLNRADLSGADLSEAKLNRADLTSTNLNGANLSEANLSGAIVGSTIFGDVNLGAVKGLDTVNHTGRSCIDIHTFYYSKDPIPPIFLQRAGIPSDFIEYIETKLPKEAKDSIELSSSPAVEEHWLNSRLRSLQKQLTIHQGNKNKLEEQLANYGIDKPLELLNTLEMTEKKIKFIQNEIKRKRPHLLI